MSHALNEELEAVRHEAQRLLREQVDPKRLEALLDTAGSFDHALWQLVAAQGWPAVALPESHGGSGLGWAGLAVLQETLGQANAALPLAPAALTLALLRAGDGATAPPHWMQGLREGSLTACVALPALGCGLLVQGEGVLAARGRLTGTVSTVAFAAVADLALVAAEDEDARTGLWLLSLSVPEVSREPVPTVDDARGLATLRLSGAPAIRLGDRSALEQLLDRAATLCAFEQLGGAQAALTLAIEHAQQRVAFGQPIARFQAIKHKLVDIYAAIEIARGCALTALALLDDDAGTAAQVADAAECHEAAAAARLAANHAFELAARDCINVFGALGVTREAAPHRHYRRARALALELGSSALWRERLVDQFLARQAVVPTV